MRNQIKNIALICVLMTAVLGNGFASAAVHNCSKISVEKSAVGYNSIKV